MEQDTCDTSDLESLPVMTWEYRVVKDGELLRVAEVFITDGKYIGFSEASFFVNAEDGETYADLQEEHRRLGLAFTKPVLDAATDFEGQAFPTERHNAFHQALRDDALALEGDHDADECDPEWLNNKRMPFGE